jgi:cysteine synthase B
MKLGNSLDLIGNTPLVELKRMSPKPGVRIFAKLEGQNPSGSIKDRIARALVESLESSGRLRPGDTLVEASSGNTAIALAFVARQKGYGLEVALPRGIAPSIEDVLSVYGVPMHWAPPVAGMKGSIDLAEQLAEERGFVPARQFQSKMNVETHYQCTGKEIVDELPWVDSFVAGIGTGGTLMGVGRRLREVNPKVRIVGIEPKLGERLQGLRSLEEGYRPPLLDLDMLDRRLLVDAAKSFQLANEVALKEGILAGVSAGATLVGALLEAERMTSGTIVCMFSDGGWKYFPARPWEAARSNDADLDDIHWW